MTAVTDFWVAVAYIAAAVRSPLAAVWHATKTERDQS